MKKRSIISYVVTFYIVAGLSFSMPASSDILFYEDFEDALKVEEEWRYSGGHGSQGFTTEQIRHGSKSYKFSLTRYDEGDYREELALLAGFNNGSYNFTIGDEYWIGFSIFLADGYPKSSRPKIHHQYHGVPDQPPTCDPVEDWRNPISTIQIEGENLWFTFKSDSRQCTPHGDYERRRSENHGPFLTGQWLDFVINVKWSYNADGFLKIWQNGSVVTNRTAEGNCFNDDTGPYLKIGIYGHLDQDQTAIIYYDELRIGDSNSSYSEVAPGDSVPTCMSEGYQCCDADDCQSGHHAEYDGDCPGQVCCEVCGATPDTCANLGGSCCNDGQICEGGSFQNSSDCGDLCCVGGICEQPPDENIFSPIPFFGDRRNYTEHTPSRWSVVEDESDLRYFLHSTDHHPEVGGLLGEFTLVRDHIYPGDFTLSFRAKTAENLSVNTKADFGIIFAYEDENNFCHMQLNSSPEFNQLFCVTAGERQTFPAIGKALIADAGYHRIELAREGRVVTLRVDGSPEIEESSLRLNAPGGVGLGTQNDAAYFDDISLEEPGSCGPGLADCNADPGDGCEVNTNTDVENCGSCGNRCGQDEVCRMGSCELQCDSPLTDCAGACVDLDSNHGNCGSCGNACDDGHKCSKGQCGPDCGPGTVEKDGVCVPADEGGCGCGGSGSQGDFLILAGWFIPLACRRRIK